MIDQEYTRRILSLRDKVAEHFDAGNWLEVGLLSGQSNLINKHARLLRSLNFGDDDYPSSCLDVLKSIGDADRAAFAVIERYAIDTFPEEGVFISAKEVERKITFAPNVFQVPAALPENDLVAVMMPFAREFDPTIAAIRSACAKVGMRCLRADDIWDESVSMQDVFNLIFKASIVGVDFSGKNANVMYETGIAHTLGKHVVPIFQSMDDLPFDLRHHKALKYLPNFEGMAKLEQNLVARLTTLSTDISPWTRGMTS